MTQAGPYIRKNPIIICVSHDIFFLRNSEKERQWFAYLHNCTNITVIAHCFIGFIISDVHYFANKLLLIYSQFLKNQPWKTSKLKYQLERVKTWVWNTEVQNNNSGIIEISFTTEHPLIKRIYILWVLPNLCSFYIKLSVIKNVLWPLLPYNGIYCHLELEARGIHGFYSPWTARVLWKHWSRPPSVQLPLDFGGTSFGTTRSPECFQRVARCPHQTRSSLLLEAPGTARSDTAGPGEETSNMKVC